MSTPKPKAPPRKDSLTEGNQRRESQKDIKVVAKKAIEEHEELKRKYSKKEEQTKLLAEELEQTREILSHLESVSGKVVEEYTDVQTKLDIEKQCRVEAEKYATKTVREIKELKRKSQMVFQQNGIDFSKIVDISLDDDLDVSDPSLVEDAHPSAHAKELEVQLEVLKDELFKAKKDLGYAMEERDMTRDDLNGAYYQISQLKEELKRETMSHELTKKALQERDNIINQLKRVSALVYDEFHEVQSLYEKESAMREEAEKMASEYYAKNKEAEAYKRQSAMLLSDAMSGDDKLQESVGLAETLTKELEQEKERHKLDIKRLQEELEMSEDKEKMEVLENKLSIAKEENESLEKRVGQLELKNKELAWELKEALSKPSLPNIPPPPPPPPVPTLPKNPLEMLQKMLGRKQKINKDPAARELDNYQKQFETAMQDMIHRIKKGQVKLKPTRINERPAADVRGPAEPGTPAVKELDNILHNLKNRKPNRYRGAPREGSSETQVDSQLRDIMEKRRIRTNQPNPPTSERPAPRPTVNPRSPSKLNKSTSLDSGIPANPTHSVPPRVAPKRSPLASTSSDSPAPPPSSSSSSSSSEPFYSSVHQEGGTHPSPPSSPSSTSTLSLSSSSHDIEVQNNPAFIHDSGDERTYASADLYSSGDRGVPAPPPPASRDYNDARFALTTDFGENGAYSLVQERPVPSPRSKSSSRPSQQPEPYYSEVNL